MSIYSGILARSTEKLSPWRQDALGHLNGVMIVTDEDFRDVQTFHDKCCRNVHAHSHAAGQQRSIPQPSELLTDIEAVASALPAHKNPARLVAIRYPQRRRPCEPCTAACSRGSANGN